MHVSNTRRFWCRPLDASDRPRAQYEYFVTGSGDFPFDMLRYDDCWPADGTAAALMTSERRNRSIAMRSYKEPTVARWASFVWSVGIEDLNP